MRRMAIAFLLVLLVPTVAPAADFTVTVQTNPSLAYVINGNVNPTLTLVRGQTYSFAVSASFHPFWIKSVSSTGTNNAYSTGVTNNGVETGTLTFAVALNAPNPLFYNCEFHPSMSGTLTIVDPTGVQSTNWGRIKRLYH